MITLLHGANRLAIDERVRGLRTENDPSGINTTVIERASEHIGELRANALASGFFGETRLVIARDLFGESAGTRARRGGRSRTSSRDEAIVVLKEVPESTLLVIVEQALAPTEARALKGSVQKLDVEQFDVPRGRDLVRWVQQRAEECGAGIADDASTRLLEALFPTSWRSVARRDDQPPDLYRLQAEVEKLATAAGEGGTINPSLINSLVPGAESANIWGLTDAIAAGDAAAAVREVERALATGTVAEALIAQLAAQFETLDALVAAGPAGTGAVAAETGLTEGRLRQASQSARRFSAERVSRGLAALRSIDVAAKRGEIETEDTLVGVVARLAADR